MSTTELDLSQPLVCSGCGAIYRDGHIKDTCNRLGCNKRLIPLVAFVSYRRKILGKDGNEATNAYAENIYLKIVEQLRNEFDEGQIPFRGGVFFDKEGMEAGNFDTQILKTIEKLRGRFFILILTAGALDKRDDPSQDWMRREIAHAVEHGLEFLILEIRDDASGNFRWPDVSENDPHHKALKEVAPKHRVPYFPGEETTSFKRVIISPIVLFLRDLGIKLESGSSDTDKPVKTIDVFIREDQPSAKSVSDDALSRFANEVRQALETDGDISANDQRYLVEFGTQNGLSADRALAIIKEVLESEQAYLQVIREVLEDGKISSIEQKILSNKAAALGISPARADILMKQDQGSRNQPSKAVDNSMELPQNLQEVAESDDDNSDLVVGDVEILWEYFTLGSMTAGHVLDSPKCEALTEYIAKYANKTKRTVRNYLEEASPDGLVKNVVKHYQDILDLDVLASWNISAAKDWNLERVIAQVFQINDPAEITKIFSETRGNTLLRNAFSDQIEKISAGNRLPDDLSNWDYHALGDMKAGEVVTHSESDHLIKGIAMFAQKSDRTVRNYLENASQEDLVKDVVKNYQDILDPDFLASNSVATARDLELEKVIAQVFKVADMAEITKILSETHGKTLLGKAFSGHWPK